MATDRSRVVEAARRALGPVGIGLPVTLTSAPSAEQQRDAVTRLERAGYRAAWANEVVGKDALVQLAILLGATERMVFGTGIANLWTREPQTLHAGAAQLADAFPDRLVLGLGGGYPDQAASTGRDYGRPLATMRAYREGMAARAQMPSPDVDYATVIAANGPKMLALAGELADGAFPAGVPPEQTRQARQHLGPDKLLVVGASVVVDADPAAARATARQRVAEMAQRSWYRAMLTQVGYGDDEIAEPSDRLVSAVFAHGDGDAIAAAVRAHLAAGADHVELLLPMGQDYAIGVEQFERIAPALMDLGPTTSPG